jgi:hypothetical protein
MYPIRRRGLMRGYRYFIADRFLFYYSVSSIEVRIAAIIPANDASGVKAATSWPTATAHDVEYTVEWNPH